MLTTQWTRNSNFGLIDYNHLTNQSCNSKDNDEDNNDDDGNGKSGKGKGGSGKGGQR
jgi:hypothetical protein